MTSQKPSKKLYSSYFLESFLRMKKNHEEKYHVFLVLFLLSHVNTFKYFLCIVKLKLIVSPPVRSELLDFMLVFSFPPLPSFLPSSAIIVFFNREPHVFSARCQTSTASLCVQCSPQDLYGEQPRPMFPARPRSSLYGQYSLLKIRAHTLDEWPYISDSTWPSILLSREGPWLSASLLMEQLNRNMAAKKPQMRCLRQ